MLIMLKTTCFGLWLAMMIMLILANQVKTQPERLSIYLEDPARAERQIYDSLHNLGPGMQLNLEISEYHPACAELYLIASCIKKKNPSILINLLWLKNHP